MSLTRTLPITKIKLDILFEIYSEKENYLRNIAKNTRINPSLVHRNITLLYKAGMLEKREQGKEIFYSMKKNPLCKIVQSMLEEYSLEKAVSKSRALKSAVLLTINNHELMKKSKLILIFGSYAAGNFTQKSDIDMLIVTKDRNFAVKSCREISALVNKSINPVIYTPEKFKRELRKGEPFLCSIIKKIRNRIIIK